MTKNLRQGDWLIDSAWGWSMMVNITWSGFLFPLFFFRLSLPTFPASSQGVLGFCWIQTPGHWPRLCVRGPPLLTLQLKVGFPAGNAILNRASSRTRSHYALHRRKRFRCPASLPDMKIMTSEHIVEWCHFLQFWVLITTYASFSGLVFQIIFFSFRLFRECFLIFGWAPLLFLSHHFLLKKWWANPQYVS